MAYLAFLFARAGQVIHIVKAGESGDESTGQGGMIALTWVLGIAMLLLLLLIGFKKSKRSHLD